MDNSFIIKLFLNGKDVTEQYSVINAKIYRACNKIDKATISISADIIDNSQFEIPDNKIFNPGTELKFQAGPTDFLGRETFFLQQREISKIFT